MRALLFALFVCILFSGCSPKTTAQTVPDRQAPPNPGLVGPPPAPATAPPPSNRVGSLVQDTDKFAPTAKDTSLLWRISAPGITEPSYLFGTIHLIPAEDYFLPQRVVTALNESKRVVFEIDPRDMQDPAMLMRLMSKINMRGDTSLEDLLDAEQYAAVEGYFSDQGMPFFLFKRMKPMFLSAMVGQDMGAMGGGEPEDDGAMGMKGMKSYEFELTEIAEASGKELSGLESMDFQLSIFDSIPYKAQAIMLYDAVQADGAEEGSEAASQLDQLVAIYRRQAVAELAQTITDEAEGVARFEELLLTKRNANWVPVIKAATEAGATGTSFYAVGAGHLGGAKGVIALLRAEGLTVEPVY